MDEGIGARARWRRATAWSAGAILGACAVALAVTPVPYVVLSPGLSQDLLRPGTVTITGVPNHPASGAVVLVNTDMSPLDHRVTLPEALWARVVKRRQLQPRERLHRPGESQAAEDARFADQLSEAKENATVAAARAAGVAVKDLPQVMSVTQAGPAYDRLQVGDYILRVDGRPVSSAADVAAVVASRRVGDVLNLGLLRDGVDRTEAVTIVAGNDEAYTPSIGAKLGIGHVLPLQVGMAIDPEVRGVTSGLALALATYDLLTPGDLTGGHRVAATGLIDATGTVTWVSGSPEKLASAEAAGAEWLLVPESSCEQLAGVRTSVRVVPVASLVGALAALALINDPTSTDKVPTCP